MTLVTWLSDSDVDAAREIGRLRQESAVKHHRPDHAPVSAADSLDFDENAAIAELALAAYVHLPWNSEVLEQLGVKRPDVGDDLDVKWTKYANGHLIVKDREPAEWRYVLARGYFPKLELVGWIAGADAKRFPADERAAVASDHWVPDSALRPIDEIAPAGRELVCRLCRETVLVTELPREWIEPELYVCGTCLEPVDGSSQLELTEKRKRREHRTYDPAQAAIPF